MNLCVCYIFIFFWGGGIIFWGGYNGKDPGTLTVLATEEIPGLGARP